MVWHRHVSEAIARIYTVVALSILTYGRGASLYTRTDERRLARRELAPLSNVSTHALCKGVLSWIDRHVGVRTSGGPSLKVSELVPFGN